MNGIKILLTVFFMMLSGLGNCAAAQDLQAQADKLREAGKTLDALDLYNRALVGYQKERNYGAILYVLTGRLISWQHLYNHENSKVYAILARKEAEAIMSISKEFGIHDKDHLIHYLLGKSCIFLEDFSCAESEFQQAVDLYPSGQAEKGDWMAHLGEAVYRNGQKEKGKAIILSGVDYINAHAQGLESYTVNVWISGAYLRLAKILINDDLNEAKFYLQKGEEVTSGDERLVIRRQQVEKLKKKIEKQELR